MIQAEIQAEIQALRKPVTLSEIIAKLEVMDKSLAKTLETGDSNNLEEYSLCYEDIHKAIYGRTYFNHWIEPTFKGHIHAPKHLEYLLSPLVR
jgi:hypothetical protein